LDLERRLSSRRLAQWWGESQDCALKPDGLGLRNAEDEGSTIRRGSWEVIVDFRSQLWERGCKIDADRRHLTRSSQYWRLPRQV
jgi:hypothetical protein